MAGQLTISTLSDGTNGTSSTNCIQGSAKAWVNFDGTTGARASSYNVSSVTVSSTGTYLVNLTNALADANWTMVSAIKIDTTTVNPLMVMVNQLATSTSSVVPVTTRQYNGTQYTPLNVYVAVFR